MTRSSTASLTVGVSRARAPIRRRMSSAPCAPLATATNRAMRSSRSTSTSISLEDSLQLGPVQDLDCRTAGDLRSHSRPGRRSHHHVGGDDPGLQLGVHVPETAEDAGASHTMPATPPPASTPSPRVARCLLVGRMVRFLAYHRSHTPCTTTGSGVAGRRTRPTRSPAGPQRTPRSRSEDAVMSMTVSPTPVAPSVQPVPPEHDHPPAAGRRGERTVPPSPRWVVPGRAGGGGAPGGGGGANSRRGHHQLGRGPLHHGDDRWPNGLRHHIAHMIRRLNRSIRRATVVRLTRYSAVSFVATATSLVTLGVLVGLVHLPATWSNIVATAVGTVPSFELNRRWVWRSTGRRSVFGQIMPFCALSFTGLVASTLAVGMTAAVRRGGAIGATRWRCCRRTSRPTAAVGGAVPDARSGAVPFRLTAAASGRPGHSRRRPRGGGVLRGAAGDRTPGPRSVLRSTTLEVTL